MSYDVLIDKNAFREIKRFPSRDIQRIKETLKKSLISRQVKKMAGTRNIYRVRVGENRILLELEIHTLQVSVSF